MLMAAWVFSLREPRRGRYDAVAGGDAVTGDAEVASATRSPVARTHPLEEFASVIPPLTLWMLWRAGAGPRGLAWNVGAAGVLAGAAWGLTTTLGEPAQWGALAGGLYAALSWGQGLRLRDRDAFDRIFRNRAFMYASTGFATISFVTNGFVFWTAPYLLRAHDVSSTRVGALMGIGSAIGGWIGTTAGGVISDRLKLRTPAGRVYMGIAAVLLATPAYVLLVRAPSVTIAFWCFMLMIAVAALWLGPGAASANELVPPRIRSTASAVYLLLNVMIGFALGPYSVGKLSDALAAAGQGPAESLGNAMLLSTLFWVISLAFLWRARRYVGPAEAALGSEGTL
jgi:hypothetical protein